jgi:hypothetical protein
LLAVRSTGERLKGTDVQKVVDEAIRVLWELFVCLTILLTIIGAIKRIWGL